MRIWLDDERDPKSEVIKKIFGSFGTEVWVKTAEEAIELLKTNNAISISLDHDLGTEKTGYDVAKFIEESAENGTLKELRCYVHTQNPIGRVKIKAALYLAKQSWSKANN